MCIRLYADIASFEFAPLAESRSDLDANDGRPRAIEDGEEREREREREREKERNSDYLVDLT
jgi:hypothetical protein